MTALVVERDENARQALVALLSQLGYGPVLLANSMSRQAFYAARLQEQIRLIIGSDMEPGKPFAHLAENIAHEEGLFLTPLIQVVSPWQRLLGRSTHARVDGLLARPFGLRALKRSLRGAYSHRSLQRDVALHLGPAPEKACLHSGLRNSHFEQIVSVASLAELNERLRQLGPRVGAVLITPPLVEEGAQCWAARFKRGTVGRVTPLAVLSRDPREVHAYRQTADLFFTREENTEAYWNHVLCTLTHRLRTSWRARELILQARRTLKSGQLEKSARAIKTALSMDPSRAEFLELAGLLAEKRGRSVNAVELFRQALQDNPCAPMPYLKLIRLLQSRDEKKHILKLGADYCPAHPQVQGAILGARQELHL